MRRYIYIIVGILVLVVIGLLSFWFFMQNQSSPATNGGTTGLLPTTGTQAGIVGSNSSGASGNLPATGVIGGGSSTTKFGLISNEPIFSYFVDPQNNVEAVEPDGKIAEITNGQVSYLSSSGVAGLIDAGFSYDGTMALVNFGDTENPQTSVFNVATKSWNPLPEGLISPHWSPADYRIAYLINASTTETLTTLDVSKVLNRPTALITLDARDLDLKWLNKNQIILFDKPSAYTEGSAWLFDLQKKSLTPIVVEWPGFEAAWTNNLIGSTTPMGLVFQSTASARGGSLQLIDLSGNTIENLNFLTLPSKCLFNEALISDNSSSIATSTSNANRTSTPSLVLYCGIPTNQDVLSSARLPDDYNQMSLFTSDQIYRINIIDGTITTILSSQTNALDVSNLKIFNNTLFFVNRYDQKLYAISLSAG